MKVLIGSSNKSKIEGTLKAFQDYFNDVEVVGIKVESCVSSQPINKEIYEGAKNRVQNLKKYALDNNINANFYVALEGGIENLLSDNYVQADIAYIEDNNGISSVGISEGFPIPDKYIESVLKSDLGTVMKSVFPDDYSSKGTVYLLTQGKCSRIDLSKNAVRMALTKFINDSKWV
jgi:inosine/xanthosine triphosphatase